MSTPAHLWLTDEKDAPIIGGCLMPTRLGSIEIKTLTHNISIPVDSNSGKLTGTRIHTPIIMQKEFESSMFHRPVRLPDDEEINARFKTVNLRRSLIANDYNFFVSMKHRMLSSRQHPNGVKDISEFVIVAPDQAFNLALRFHS